MKKNVVAPSVGESITEVSILKWAKQHGQAVKTGELLLEIESDKATVEIVAEHTGTLQILKQAGERIPVGETIGFIDDAVAASAGAPPTASAETRTNIAIPPLPGTPPPMGAPAMSGMPPLPPSPPGMAAMPPLPGAMPSMPAVPSAPPSFPAAMPSLPGAPAAAPAHGGHGASTPGLSPSVRRAAAQTGVDPSSLHGTGKDGRVTKGDVLGASSGASSGGATAAGAPSFASTVASMAPPTTAPMSAPTQTPTAPTPSLPKAPVADKPGDRRVPMSMLRAKIAERLVMAQHTAAILTTFNEVDMSAVMKLRSEHKDAFKAKHGVNLSFMSFFAKASIAALKAIPEVNAGIDGKDIVYHDYYDVGIAVGTERGLVVPVIRGADQLSFVEMEKKIGEFAIKGRDGKLTMADLTGGTFTISNGGTYGSLMSTPILNPPQSGILGMHKIMDRPMAINGKVEIRPMMYTALSYDHRIIDGKGAVTWLVTLKDFLENPEKLGFTY
jgi:2-oxoglutarate dehydrogenase E2 component (dihydrolipoamide succinyltransferase)